MRLIIVSNRLPFTIKKLKNKIEFKESSGGLTTGISSYLESLKSSSFIQKEHLWIGWCGTTIENNLESSVRSKSLNHYNALPVFLDQNIMEKFYTGFCNKTIWPLFHCFALYTHYDKDFWDSYKQVNEIFCENIIKILKPTDIVWIHDYHLMLLPKLIREKIPQAQIGFFLHIPFPPHEIFCLLPKTWRTEILEGLLGADLAGFHTNDYTQNFFKCVLRILGLEQNLGTIVLNDRIFRADTFPMGIHFNKFFESAILPQTIKEKKLFAQILKNVKTILSVDRLDYTKGILNRLEGFELFLEKNVQWHKKVTFLLMVIPSRIGVDNYQRMKTKIDESVGKINGRFGTIDWTPVVYQYKHLPFHTLVALYNMCDVGLITPLRDGMNLVAKEFLASKTDKTGVLILSEMAGAAKELGEAIIINPNHKEEIASSIKDALEMPYQEQQQRNEIMQKRLQSYDVIHWVEDFITELNDVNKTKTNYNTKILSITEKNNLLKNFKTATNKIIFLDYDGTLVPFFNQPEKTLPDTEVFQILSTLSKSLSTNVVIISGRNKITLQNWFKIPNISLVAEHGAWIKESNKDWKLIKPINSDFKSKLIPILKSFSDKIPGSFVEEKEFSIVWHYRNSDTELASTRAKELLDDLIFLTANMDLQVLQGNKVIEIRNFGINKGIAVNYFISKNNFDFILAIGDDWTDEDIFKSLPPNAYSIKVGLSPSYAKFNLEDYKEVRKLLFELLK